MRKFQVRVIRADEYEVTIDEAKINEEFTKNFESWMFNLGSDKLRKIAEHVAFNIVEGATDIEGVGGIKVDNIPTSKSEEITEGIEVNSIWLNDVEIESREI